MSPPRVLITAGPTHEPIDQVRYIGNRSSGRMGIALAEACNGRGWPVTLLLGPIGQESIVPLSLPQDRVFRFQSTADLQTLLHQHWPGHDLLLMAAAVADFRPRDTSHAKMKRTTDGLTLHLVPTPDLLASLAKITRADQTVVGFALEPADSLQAEAKRKLQAKQLDAIVANPLETMDALDISAMLLFRTGESVMAPANMPKADFARWLLDRLATMVNSRRG